MTGPPVVEREPVDGAALLDEVRHLVAAYVVMPSEPALDAFVLFIAATHAQPAWEHAARFVLKSPIKRCGKTRAQEMARELVHRPLATTNISVAALVRSIDEEDPPVVMLDEADTVFGKKNSADGAEDLRGILNSGHSRGWPYLRWDMKARQIEPCPTFAMALLGGIGNLPDTIEDRAVVVSMRRRAPGEPVRQFRRKRVVPVLHELRDRLHAWLRSEVDTLEHADPELPVEDRAADVWQPLVAVADLAGGVWPSRSRAACVALTCDSDDDGTAGERLLADLHAVWGESEQHFTVTLLERLHALEESPWGDWFGKPLTARGMARLLRPYGARSRTLRLGDHTAKGYHRTDLADSWHRYVSSVTTSQEAEAAGQAGDVSVTDRVSRTVTPSDQGQCTPCDGVTDGTGGHPHGAVEVDEWEHARLAALDPDDPDYGLAVARARATAVLARRGETLGGTSFFDPDGGNGE